MIFLLCSFLVLFHLLLGCIRSVRFWWCWFPFLRSLHFQDYLSRTSRMVNERIITILSLELCSYYGWKERKKKEHPTNAKRNYGGSDTKELIWSKILWGFWIVDSFPTSTFCNLYVIMDILLGWVKVVEQLCNLFFPMGFFYVIWKNIHFIL